MQFSKKFKATRLKYQITQKTLSDSLGLTTPQFISNWERSVSYPPVESLKTVARTLNKENAEKIAEELLLALKQDRISAIKANLDKEFNASK